MYLTIGFTFSTKYYGTNKSVDSASVISYLPKLFELTTMSHVIICGTKSEMLFVGKMAAAGLWQTAL